MSLLYLATFGSFIGFSAGFAMLSKTQFPDVQILHYAFSVRLSARWRVRQAAQFLTVWGDSRHAYQLCPDGDFQRSAVPDITYWRRWR